MDSYLDYLDSPLFEARHSAYKNIKRISFERFPQGFRGYRRLYIGLSVMKETLWIISHLGRRTQNKYHLADHSKVIIAVSENATHMANIFQRIYSRDDIVILKDFQFSISYLHLLEIVKRILQSVPEIYNSRHYTNATEYFRYITLNILLSKHKYPYKLALFLNDHSSFEYAFSEVLKKQGITIGYIQHSWIDSRWKLNRFDVLFLDGPYFERMFRDNINQIVFNTGCLYVQGRKIDISMSDITKPRNIGVCISQSTDNDTLNKCISFYKLRFPFARFLVRPHPSDLRKFQIASNNAILTRHGNGGEFIERVDILIAGNSNILYEALLLQRTVFYDPELDRASYDYYGFVRRGIVRDIRLLKELDKPVKVDMQDYSFGFPSNCQINFDAQRYLDGV